MNVDQLIEMQNFTDNKGNPAGGYAKATGMDLRWQAGPAKTIDEVNGTFVETVLEAVATRLEFYQNSRFWCEENEDALHLVRAAIVRQRDRTRKRVEQGVEGEHREHVS